MSAAQLVAQPTKTITFTAPYGEELRLVKTPEYPIFGPSGAEVGSKPGEAVQFKGCRLEVPQSGKMRLADGREGDAAEILEWLRSHRLFGDLWRGFVEMKPDAPEPTPEEFDRIMQAGIVGDEETLTAIIEQEEAGFARDAILKPARAGLEKVREVLAKLKEEERAEQERAAAEAAKAQTAKPPKPSGQS